MSSKANILLIDDEKSFYDQLRPQLNAFYTLIFADTAAKAEKSIRTLVYDLILLDLVLEKQKTAKEGGLKLIKTIKQIRPNVPIIIVTKHNETKYVVEAMRLGAVDFFYKESYDLEEWKEVIDSCLKKLPELPTENKNSKNKPQNKPFIGGSEAIKQIKKILERLSKKPDLTLLLTGETGVGKEVAAQYLHTHGARNKEPFRAINLSTITKSIMESRLFGHRKGTFTDAKGDSTGLFEQANGGILFLDEIGEIDMDMQVKLLRVLQEKIITPIGGEDIYLDIQIVAATNKNLEEEVKAGRFRDDLFYRLNQFPIEIPPLRERRDDLEILLEYYLNEEGEAMNILTTDAKVYLIQEYLWPGNIRELVNWIRSACLKRDLLDMSQIDLSLCPKYTSDQKKYTRSTEAVPDSILGLSKGVVDKKHAISGLDWQASAAFEELSPIEEALKKYGKKNLAGNALNLSLDNLRYKVKKHYKKYPQIFEHFPFIKAKYNL